MGEPERPIRILQFLWRLSVTGGIQRVVRDLIGGLNAERFEVHLCTARPVWEEDRLDQLGRSAALAGTIGRLAGDDELRRSMGGRAAAKARREFDQRQVIEITLGVYEQLGLRGSSRP
ncbi:MAG: hypothetical protein ACRDWW_06665 [Acidimicrobiales bacterium]